MDMDSKEIGQIVRAAREARELSQTRLGALIGIKQASIQAIEKGETNRSKFLPEIARELGIPPEAVGLPAEPERQDGIVRNVVEAKRDFPIYASAEGGPGEIIRSVDAVDWYPRPASVAHVREAYGLIVIGDSMWPKFEPGDIVLVNPVLPPVPGSPCIFYAELRGEARATLKLLRRATTTHWMVSQYNPPRGASPDFQLSRKEWRICHRVIGQYFPH